MKGEFSKLSGAYGRVYEGFCRRVRVAVKVLKVSEYDSSALDDMRREAVILR